VRKSALFLFGLVVTMLVALGLIVLSSASEANGIRLHHGDAYHFIRQQFVYLGLGLVVAAVVASVDYRRWSRQQWITWLFVLVILALLLLVFKFPPINGSRRWIRLVGGLRLQPAEFAKLAVVIVVSVWMDRIAWQVDKFKKGVLVPMGLIGVLAAPVLFEPDYGSVLVLGMAGLLAMFVAGSRIRHMLPFVLAGGGIFAYKVLTTGNRMARIAAYLGIKINIGAQVSDAAADRAAYQAHQALVALCNGGLWGVGLGQSMQKHYYLPEAHTDFIFAIGAEELGMPFSVGVLLLFCLFFALSVYIAAKASDRLGKFLVVGMAFLIFFQAIFNIGMVCAAYPTKGMALPFFSYGGTNMLSSFFAVGMILSVGIHSYRDTRRQFVAKVLKRGD